MDIGLITEISCTSTGQKADRPPAFSDQPSHGTEIARAFTTLDVQNAVLTLVIMKVETAILKAQQPVILFQKFESGARHWNLKTRR